MSNDFKVRKLSKFSIIKNNKRIIQIYIVVKMFVIKQY